jgi:hypothetical protein
MTDERKSPPKQKPARKMTKAEQSERFIKTARELGVDETGEEFERAFRKIVRPRRPRSKSSSPPSTDALDE